MRTIALGVFIVAVMYLMPRSAFADQTYISCFPQSGTPSGYINAIQLDCSDQDEVVAMMYRVYQQKAASDNPRVEAFADVCREAAYRVMNFEPVVFNSMGAGTINHQVEICNAK